MCQCESMTSLLVAPFLEANGLPGLSTYNYCMSQRRLSNSNCRLSTSNVNLLDSMKNHQ